MQAKEDWPVRPVSHRRSVVPHCQSLVCFQIDITRYQNAVPTHYTNTAFFSVQLSCRLDSCMPHSGADVSPRLTMKLVALSPTTYPQICGPPATIRSESTNYFYQIESQLLRPQLRPHLTAHSPIQAERHTTILQNRLRANRDGTSYAF